MLMLFLLFFTAFIPMVNAGPTIRIGDADCYILAKDGRMFMHQGAQPIYCGGEIIGYRKSIDVWMSTYFDDIPLLVWIDGYLHVVFIDPL